ncbi:hypothetical protein KY334_02635 [Candidatus Woesearchaeota archaeon]|nr:hypothetical protein [Candidatus Woesearchaeota archaeon]
MNKKADLEGRLDEIFNKQRKSKLVTPIYLKKEFSEYFEDQAKLNLLKGHGVLNYNDSLFSYEEAELYMDIVDELGSMILNNLHKKELSKKLDIPLKYLNKLLKESEYVRDFPLGQGLQYYSLKEEEEFLKELDDKYIKIKKDKVAKVLKKVKREEVKIKEKISSKKELKSNFYLRAMYAMVDFDVQGDALKEYSYAIKRAEEAYDTEIERIFDSASRKLKIPYSGLHLAARLYLGASKDSKDRLMKFAKRIYLDLSEKEKKPWIKKLYQKKE